ncbi:hypothetical protein F5887DRAFT_16632 [Amanita rubescens]|nr:hypothetical protein F5887DRAFT_16632 [Amanita rubescens]
MNKKVKAYQKKMAVESRDDKKNAKQQSDKQVAGPSSGGQLTARKRGRDSSSSHVDPNKRQKVADKQVNMERRGLTSSSSKDNVELETDRAPEDVTRRKAPARVSSNEPELKTFRVLYEQPVEGLQVMDHRDDDTEERSEVDKMLENVASNTNISEDQSTGQQAHDVSPPPSVMRTEATIVKSLAQHSDGSFNSLFDDDFSEHVSDSEKELSNVSHKIAEYRLPREDNFFRSSPEASASGCSPPVNKVKTPAKRNPLTLIEGAFTSTFVKRLPKTGESDGDESTNDSPHRPSRPIKKSKTPTEERRHSPVQNVITASAEASPEGDDADVWPPIRRVRASNLPAEAPEYREKQSEQVVEVAPTKELEKKPDNKNRRPRASLDRNDIRHDRQSAEWDLIEPKGNDQQLGHAPGGQSHRRSSEPLPETLEHLTAGDLKFQPIYDDDKHIDLLEERRRKKILRQSAGSSRTDSVVATHSLSHRTRQSPSLSLYLSTQDQSFVATLGIQRTISLMSKNHGFRKGVVKRILETVHSIAKADEILRLMRIKAEEEATRQLTANMAEPSDSISTSRRKPASKEHLFQISQLSDDGHSSDYSPPPKTRAGRFARLVEQGRHAEARTREARRASGTVSPAKLVLITPDKSKSGGNSPSRNFLISGNPIRSGRGCVHKPSRGEGGESHLKTIKNFSMHMQQLQVI